VDVPDLSGWAISTVKRTAPGCPELGKKQQTFIGSWILDDQEMAFVFALFGSSLIGEFQVGTYSLRCGVGAWQMLPFLTNLTHHQDVRL
jgi:hypothetical protein